MYDLITSPPTHPTFIPQKRKNTFSSFHIDDYRVKTKPSGKEFEK